MINYNAALPAGNYPASKSSINVTDWIQGIKGNLSYLIRQAFRGGEVGFAYDPNDLTTMFQDAVGTVPVTAVGQPVGLVLDKSKGLMLGNETIVGGDFENGLIGVRSEGSGSVSTWELNTVNPISGTKDGKLTITTASASRPSLRFPVSTSPVIGKTYRLSFDYKVTSGSAIITQVNNGSASTYNVNKTLTGSGTFVVLIPWQSNTTLQPYIYFGESIATIQIDNVSFKELAGNHAYQTVSASRPVLRKNDVTGAYYLEFDGADDFLQTNSIDFTGTDKVSLFAGVRKLSDATTQMIVELSTLSGGSNSGTFGLFAPLTVASPEYHFRSAGAGGSIGVSASPFSAPISSVLCNKSSIADKIINIRVNGVSAASSSTSQGTGNYGNYLLYIGRRAGASFPFNGHVYGLIGIGRLTTDAETIALEKSIAKNTGVTLSV